MQFFFFEFKKSKSFASWNVPINCTLYIRISGWASYSSVTPQFSVTPQIVEEDFDKAQICGKNNSNLIQRLSQ